MSMPMPARCVRRCIASRPGCASPSLSCGTGRGHCGRQASPNVQMILVGDRADAADDWIAERITDRDVCVTSDIPLAARCLAKGARIVPPSGRPLTQANIGSALAGRELARHLREIGVEGGGPAPLTRQDRSRFLSALDTALQAALRVPMPT